MNPEKRVEAAWLRSTNIALEVAEARDGYLPIRGCEDRFMLLETAYEASNRLGDGAYQYVEAKKPLIGSKPDAAVATIIEAGETLMRVVQRLAVDDQTLRRVSDDGRLTNDQQIIFWQSRANDRTAPQETKDKANAILKRCFEVRRAEVLGNIAEELRSL